MTTISLKEDHIRFLASLMNKSLLKKKDVRLDKIQMIDDIEKRFRKAMAKNKHSPMWSKNALRIAERMLRGIRREGLSGGQRIAMAEIRSFLKGLTPKKK